MSCGCGEQFQRVFPATVKYTVYFDETRETNPLRWEAKELVACVICGRIESGVPDTELQELRRGAGEI